MKTSAGLRPEPITSANLDTALAIRVRPEQEFAVDPVVKSLAEAYVHGGEAWPRLILGGDRPVGFLMGFFGVFHPGLGFGPNGEKAGEETAGVLELGRH
ncbi:hypothetical protein [Streptomyces tendae]|uniref:hypothetical protein n=1 Tax=Streptomyces tendae TaxID=1932 RepID=UPI0036AEB3EF